MKIAEELRTSIYEETGLTCSAGIAPNRLLAKLSRIILNKLVVLLQIISSQLNPLLYDAYYECRNMLNF